MVACLIKAHVYDRLVPLLEQLNASAKQAVLNSGICFQLAWGGFYNLICQAKLQVFQILMVLVKLVTGCEILHLLDS